MPQELRKTGIPITGDVPWSSHFCLFYRTRRELLDILIPYFRAGLENKELCVWITGAPLAPASAAGALRKAVPGFDTCLERGQIEILTSEEFYGCDGLRDTGQRLAGWKSKYERAVAHGFEGLRVTEDDSGQKKDRSHQPEYETALKCLIDNNRVLFLCTSSLIRGGSRAILDALNDHDFAILKRDAGWKIIESNPHRQTKEAIEASERRYRQLLETTNEGVWVAATDGRTIYVNQRMADMLGCSIEDCLKGRRDDFFDPEYYDFAMKIRAEREKGISGQYELRLRCRDGSPLWVLVSGSPVYDESGKHIANLGMHKDITDRKRAEEEFQISRRFLEIGNRHDTARSLLTEFVREIRAYTAVMRRE